MADTYNGTPYMESSEIDEPGPTPIVSSENRRGHLFFGSICDMRNATFAVHGFNILLKIIFMIVRHITLGHVTASVDIMSMILSAIAIFGAYTYEYLASGLAAAGFVFFLLANFISFDLIGAIADFLLLYPVAVLTYEMRVGIITKENYAQEEYIEPQLREQIESGRQQFESQVGRFTASS